jgi:hypothetical protein
MVGPVEECSDDAAVPLNGEAPKNAAVSDELGVKVNEGGLLMGEGLECFVPAAAVATGDGGAEPAERDPMISSATGEEDMVLSVECR